MRLALTLSFFLISILSAGQITVISKEKHFAIIKKGKQIFLEREDYLNDKIYGTTTKADTVTVTLADLTFFKFTTDTLTAWSLTGHVDLKTDIFTDTLLYKIDFPFDLNIRTDVYVFDAPITLASKIFDVKKDKSIVVISRQNDFFEIEYKDRTGYVHKDFILPFQSRHPIREAISKSSTYGNSSTKGSNKSYKTGSRGGCFYINSSGKKVYVDRSQCR